MSDLFSTKVGDNMKNKFGNKAVSSVNVMKGDDGQMEGSIANALFDEWTSQQQYNTTDKAILPVEFANV